MRKGALAMTGIVKYVFRCQGVGAGGEECAADDDAVVASARLLVGKVRQHSTEDAAGAGTPAASNSLNAGPTPPLTAPRSQI